MTCCKTSQSSEKHFTHYCECLYRLSCVQLFVTPWTVALQAPLSMGFPRQEYWSGFPFPSPGDLLNPGIKPTSLASPAPAGGFFTMSTTLPVYYCYCFGCTTGHGGILVPRSWIKPAPSAVEAHGVLTTGPPRKSQLLAYYKGYLGFPSGTSGKECT